MFELSYLKHSKTYNIHQYSLDLIFFSQVEHLPPQLPIHLLAPDLQAAP